MYNDKTSKELVELLGQQSLLTFEAQLNLKQILNEKNIVVDTEDLEQSIHARVTEINTLSYLADLGFKATTNTTGITITRLQKAVWGDITAVVLGGVVFLVGVYGAGSLVSMFVNGEEINVFNLALNAAITSLLLTGFSFFNGLKRLFDYSGFQLSNDTGDDITLKKRFDLKLEEVTKKSFELQLEADNNVLTLKLGNHTIFKANEENVIQRLTLEHLTKVLKKE